jgi:serine/threonine protein phosphatase PrpC
LSYELVKDGKSLTVEQQKSDWDSQAVLEQHVLKKTTDYLALQAQGLTIYMYGDNQAVWVNQGTLYTLSGDHGIDQDDIIRMATSL